MKGLLLSVIVLLTACERPRAPQLAVTRLPELPDGATLRISPEAGTPSAVVGATAGALKAAGFRVFPERGTGRIYVAMLSARCEKRFLRGYRCKSFGARVVDPQTSLIVAAAAVNPLNDKPLRLSEIADSLASRLRRLPPQ